MVKPEKSNENTGKTEDEEKDQVWNEEFEAVQIPSVNPLEVEDWIEVGAEKNASGVEELTNEDVTPGDIVIVEGYKNLVTNKYSQIVSLICTRLGQEFKQQSTIVRLTVTPLLTASSEFRHRSRQRRRYRS
ncbi:unnamed protein product [Lactuca virosa]|uniref:Uncharacterized protein n=1 Tax=Lactuca virosa TaxID=75947 RepID=A0AAU9NVN2_9ASTR|nr:unnamed protein product [Lactuca virosa]